MPDDLTYILLDDVTDIKSDDVAYILSDDVTDVKSDDVAYILSDDVTYIHMSEDISYILVIKSNVRLDVIMS